MRIAKKFPSYFEIPEWAREQELEVYRACATGKVDQLSFLNSYEEIRIFKSRIVNKEVIIKPQLNRFLIVDTYRKTYNLSDDFFKDAMHRPKDTFWKFLSDYRIKCTFA